MNNTPQNPSAASRRRFLQVSSLATGAALSNFVSHRTSLAQEAKSQEKNDRPIVGCIGTGSRWNAVGRNAMKFGDVVAVCDVDANHADKAKAKVKEVQDRDAEVFSDYRKVLDNKDIEIVTIVTPDHWHTKIAIDAMRAGKDVYCEKPLTLTIEEGQQIARVCRETNRVFQVGTQQRSEMGLRFLKALALIREGRLGNLKTVQCAIGGAPKSGPLETAEVPGNLDWDMWLGQAPKVDYIPRRCHYEFRWWYEYSGGKMTDWGAHHVDIAHWGLGFGDTGPVEVTPKMVEHPVEFKDGYPQDASQYNTATKFLVECKFATGEVLTIRHDTTNGILFEGDKGRIFVSRGSLKGKPVEDLESNPLPEDAITKVYNGKQPGDHMRNFIECVKLREQPISDVYSHHRALTTCHLANIALRLNRAVKWDPKAEKIVGDDEAAAWVRREQREGFEIEA